MRKIISAGLFILMQLGFILQAQESAIINVFQKGEEGYACFRIPAIVQSKSGTLLAFAEARKNSCSDTGNIDLVLKRSEDGGKNWSRIITVWDDQNNVCGNPVPMIDQATGKIILVACWNSGEYTEKQIMDKKSSDCNRRVYVLYSDDDGKNWTNPKEITPTVKLSDWGWYATGPCHGIQLQNKKHKGRLVVPANYSTLETKERHSHLIYSDDLGGTWELGGLVKEPGGNESSVVELKNGDLMLNMAKWGNSNCIVTNNDPEALGNLTHLFDMIVADVPCSGEGMFRKNTDSANQWSEANITLCAARSRRIIHVYFSSQCI